ncbi:MAG TPA: glycoside hydrolase family 15 protein [Methylomirabilota bacterium]|nr:glycoside hydrolase family 15 protein [Methylomirabilota bacterium]
MALRIESYALIGDTHTVALVGDNGSIDWLCLPRFDAPACFAALLGTDDNGRWQIAPAAEVVRTRRRYRGPTLVLETEFETAHGAARLVDCMPPRGSHARIVRVVEGVRGEVPMRMRFRPRFDYGRVRPWVSRGSDVICAAVGPDALELRGDVPIDGDGDDPEQTASFTVTAGQRVGFLLTFHTAWEAPPFPVQPAPTLARTEGWWREWSARSTYRGGWADEVKRSLITLKALTYEPTGGIVTAATTSLPESLGGVRNWDYRYCCLRDAAPMLDVLMSAGYVDEAARWRDWVLRAVAGDAEDLQVMYGPGGERRLDEYELDWLLGYEYSRPVRVGNAASGQRQLDVYGEVTDAVFRARGIGVTSAQGWSMLKRAVDWVQAHWREPDEGLWEVRGRPRHFVHSKVMAWVAADRMVRAIEESKLDGPAERFRRLRSDIHAEVCREGYDSVRNTFTQYYGSAQLDAALLLIPQVGFLPPSDLRVVGTVEAIQRELVRDGLVMRYVSDERAADGLPPGEGAFLECSFWLVNALAMIGRRPQAEELFRRLLSLRNDVGLLSEEYDPAGRRMVGNFPQAFSHLALISSARVLS